MNIEIKGDDAWDVEILMYLNSIPESNRAAVVKMGLLGFFRQNYPSPSGTHIPILQPTTAAPTEAITEPTKLESPPKLTIPQAKEDIQSSVLTVEPPKNNETKLSTQSHPSSLEKTLIPSSIVDKMKEDKRRARQKRLANR